MLASAVQPCSNAKKLPKTQMYHYSPSRSQCEFCVFLAAFGFFLAAFQETEWNCAELASHLGACSVAPACHLRGTCMAPAWHLRGTCVQAAWPAWRLRRTCAAPACKLRGKWVACVHLRATYVERTKEFIFLSFHSEQRNCKNRRKRKKRKAIVVFTRDFCGLHFVPTRSGSFALITKNVFPHKAPIVAVSPSTPHPKSESAWHTQDSRGYTKIKGT